MSDYRFNAGHLLLYAVTDRSWTGEETLYEQVEKALKGGVTLVQLREKSLSEDAFIKEAKSIAPLCKAYGVPLIVNDSVKVAMLCGADGVHVGQGDMSPKDVRAVAGEGLIVGVSARTPEQAIAAERAGASYLGVGAVFGTSTKLDAKPLSRDTLIEIRRAVKIPIVAIGGITRGNMLELAGSGVDGVALVSEIFASKDIENNCKELREIARNCTRR